MDKYIINDITLCSELCYKHKWNGRIIIIIYYWYALWKNENLCPIKHWNFVIRFFIKLTTWQRPCLKNKLVICSSFNFITFARSSVSLTANSVICITLELWTFKPTIANAIIRKGIKSRCSPGTYSYNFLSIVHTCILHWNNK